MVGTWLRTVKPGMTKIPGRKSEREPLPSRASAVGAALEAGEEREALSQRELSFETTWRVAWKRFFFHIRRKKRKKKMLNTGSNLNF